MYKKCALILFSTAGALTLGTTAAMAGWASYGNTPPTTLGTSTWVCGTTKPVTTDGSVVSQGCTVRTADGQYIQGAVIVRNNRTSAFTTNAGMATFYLNGSLHGSWGCSSSGVAANSWSVCFGTTVPASIYYYYTGGYANNVPLPSSGNN